MAMIRHSNPEYLAAIRTLMKNGKLIPTFRPIGVLVHFKRIPHPAPKEGELIVPRPPSEEALVIAVGHKCEHVKAGDRVLIPLKVAGITIPNFEGRLCEESQVEAIVR